MEHEHRSDRFTAIEDQYAGYEVYDRNGEKIGKVDDLFVDENDQPEYVGVKMGFLGLEGTSFIPWELARADEQGRRIEVSADKAQVKEGPSFNDDEDITPQYENEVRSHYGLGAMQGAAERGAYGDYYRGEDREGKVGPGVRMGDTETGEFRGHGRDQEGVNQPGDDLEDDLLLGDRHHNLVLADLGLRGLPAFYRHPLYANLLVPGRYGDLLTLGPHPLSDPKRPGLALSGAGT